MLTYAGIAVIDWCTSYDLACGLVSFGVMSSRNGAYGAVAVPCVTVGRAAIAPPIARPNAGAGVADAAGCPKNDVLLCPNAGAWPKVLGCAGVDVAPKPNEGAVVAGVVVGAPNAPNPPVAGLGAPNADGAVDCPKENEVGCVPAGCPNAGVAVAAGCPNVGVVVAVDCPNAGVAAGCPNAGVVAGCPKRLPPAGCAPLFSPCWFCWPNPPNDVDPNMACAPVDMAAKRDKSASTALFLAGTSRDACASASSTDVTTLAPISYIRMYLKPS